MDLHQLLKQPSNVLPRTRDLIQLQQNLKALLTHERTRSVYIELSEEVCTSGRHTHSNLYDVLAGQFDPFAGGLPGSFGFFAYRNLVIIWHLSYFADGNWQRIPAEVAVTHWHNCLLEVHTRSEIMYQ